MPHHNRIVSLVVWLVTLCQAIPLVFPSSPPEAFKHRNGVIMATRSLTKLEDSIDEIDQVALKSIKKKTDQLEKRAESKLEQGMPDDQFSPLVMEPAITLAEEEEAMGMSDEQLAQELEVEEAMHQVWSGNTTTTTSTRSLVPTTCRARDVEVIWCPQNWVAVGQKCIPSPKVKRNKCPALQYSQTLSVAERLQLSEACDAPYVCVWPRGPDFPCSVMEMNFSSRPCPLGFKLAQNKCQSITDPTATLAKPEDTDEAKQRLAEKLELAWPCREGCDRNRSVDSPCPHRFVELNNGICEAPRDYYGPCPNEWSGNNLLTEAEKWTLEIVCLTVWQCVVGS